MVPRVAPRLLARGGLSWTVAAAAAASRSRGPVPGRPGRRRRRSRAHCTVSPAAATSVGEELEAPAHASPRRSARPWAVTVSSGSSPGARRRVASPRRSRASLSSASRRSAGRPAASRPRRTQDWPGRCFRYVPRRRVPEVVARRTPPGCFAPSARASLSSASRSSVSPLTAAAWSRGGFAWDVDSALASRCGSRAGGHGWR